MNAGNGKAEVRDKRTVYRRALSDLLCALGLAGVFHHSAAQPATFRNFHYYPCAYVKFARIQSARTHNFSDDSGCSLVSLIFTGRKKVIYICDRFSPGKFGGGAYVTVNSEVGSLIDWYNVQVSHLILRTYQNYSDSYQ